MLDHIGIRTSHYAAASSFYQAVMAAMGGGQKMSVPLEYTGGKHVVGFGRDMPVFWLTEVDTGTANQSPQHIAFSARNRAEVDAFYRAAMAAGGRDNGGPGLRPDYHPDYYAAFAFDPDGNNIEAVCHKPE
jgi:catechol 2,3-dioxygenase-like lactoylglutathione lyase family enzyme